MSTPINFLGMRGSDDFITDARAKSYREVVLTNDYAGDAPMTALTNLMPSEVLPDPEHKWFEQGPLEFVVSGTANAFVYTASNLATPISNGIAAGTTIYIKMTAADAKGFVKYDQVLLIDESDLSSMIHARATADPTINGASSYLPVKTVNSDSGNIATSVDLIMKTGSAIQEGVTRPTSVSLDSTKRTTYAQIFRHSLKITGTAQSIQNLRTGQNKLKEKRKSAFQQHIEAMEMAMFTGYGTEDTDGDDPLRQMWGIMPYLETYKPDHVRDFKVDQSGQTWLGKGDEWFDDSFESLAKHNNGEMTAFAGVGALSGVNRLAKDNGSLQISPGEMKFGVNIKKWIGSNITLNLVQHPIFSRTSWMQNLIVIVTPKHLRYRYTDGRDTNLIMNDDRRDEDFISEEYLTECCMEIHHPETFMVLKNVGQGA